jgi:hypothetical protein
MNLSSAWEKPRVRDCREDLLLKILKLLTLLCLAHVSTGLTPQSSLLRNRRTQKLSGGGPLSLQYKQDAPTAAR